MRRQVLSEKSLESQSILVRGFSINDENLNKWKDYVQAPNEIKEGAAIMKPRCTETLAVVNVGD